MGATSEPAALDKSTDSRGHETSVPQLGIDAPLSASDPFVERLFHGAAGAPARSLSTASLRAPVLQRAQRLYGNRASQQIVQQARVLQRQCAGGSDAFNGIPAGHGEPLDAGVRQPLESHFQADLSDVRIHTGPEAAESARSVDALAYASGRDVYFAAGMYAPAISAGRRLIAHEVAHVVQQSSGKEPTIAAKSAHGVKIGAPDDTLESEADRAAEAFSAGALNGEQMEDERKRRLSPVQRFIQRQTSSAQPPNYTPAPPPPVLASTMPADAPAEKKKAPPGPGGTTVRVGNVSLSKDPAFVRYQLEQLVIANGQNSIDLFVAGFRDKVAKDRDVVREPARPETVAPTPSVPIQAGDKETTQLEMDILPILEQQAAKLKTDIADFITQFQAHGEDVMLEVLFNSEKRIKAEARHYGVALDPKFGPDPDASAGSSPEQADAAKKSHDDMRTAAGSLAAKHKEVVEAQAKFDDVQKQPATKEGYMYVKALYLPAQETLGKRQLELATLRANVESRFPMLAAYTSRDRWGELEDLASSKAADFPGKIAEEITDKLENIAKVRGKLNDHAIDIWKLSHVVQLTKSRLKVAPGTFEERIVKDRVTDANDETVKMVLSILLIGLALLAAIPTGGSSLIAAVALGAEVGGVLVGGYLAIEGLQDYLLQKAETGTDFDKAQAISQEDPSLFWVALDIVGVILNVRGALAAFRRLSQLRHLALIRQATRVGEAVGVAELKTVAEEGNAVKSGLGDKMRQEIVGAAQSPKMVWRPNPSGPRKLEEALDIARKNGVHIPEDIKFNVTSGSGPGGKWPEGRYAEYGILGKSGNPNKMYTWEEFYNIKQQVPVRLNPDVLESDEQIVAVIGHEMHELNSLRALFEASPSGTMDGRTLSRLISEGVPGNLHDQAWDVADALVEKMGKQP